ncbi:MAG TPA: lysophospholipid acyltransferase family protein [Novosphingobium sp.]
MTGRRAHGSEGFGLFGRLRVVLRLAAIVGWLGACVVLYYGWRLAGAVPARNPWPRRFLGGIARLAGVRMRAEGVAARPGTFLIANHVSWIDIPALAALSGAAFVAHDGLAGIPVLRRLCEMNRTVFVARHDRAGVARQVAQVRAAIGLGEVLAIFPEGTTADGTTLRPLKSSLLSALDPLPPGIVVQPVLLDYGPEARDIAWVGQEPGIDNFLRILARRRPVTLTVRFLPPLTGEALASRKTIADAAGRALETALKG